MRVWDGFLTMLGLGERVPATRRELNELRSEWRDYQLELGGLLDQLNRAAARWAKREAREAAKTAEQLVQAPAPDPALMHMPHLQGAKDRKAELRRRMAAGQLVRNRITPNGEGAE